MPVGRDGAQRFRRSRLGRMQIDAVQVIARLFRRDREPRLVDEPLQIAGLHREFMADLADRQIGEVFGGKRLQAETRLARRDRQPLLVAVALHLDLGAFRQLAHDVMQHVRRNRQRAGRRDLGADALAHLAFEVGRLEHQSVPRRLQHDVRKDRDRRPALDNARNVAQRLQEFPTFNLETHFNPRLCFGRRMLEAARARP